jgi:hypothetical protein
MAGEAFRNVSERGHLLGGVPEPERATEGGAAGRWLLQSGRPRSMSEMAMLRQFTTLATSHASGPQNRKKARPTVWSSRKHFEIEAVVRVECRLPAANP